MAIDEKGNRWFDHVEACGGGAVQLVQKALGLSQTGAIEWLRNEGFIEPRRMTRTADAARRERERQRAARLDSVVGEWRTARLADLDRSKRRALELGDDVALAESAKVEYELQRTDIAGARAAYLAHRENDPVGWRRCLELVREAEKGKSRLTAEFGRDWDAGMNLLEVILGQRID